MNHPARSNGQLARHALETFEGALSRYAAGMLRDADGARDAVQETFLSLVRQPPPPEVAQDDRRLKAWLFTVCRNRILDQRRRNGRMTLAPAFDADLRPAPAAPPPAAAEAKEDHQRVLAALAHLPDNQRECLRLKFQGGLSYREIAEVTGLQPGYVGYLIHHGLKALREKLTD